jgi:putative ABC transport system ATP-binding protein
MDTVIAGLEAGLGSGLGPEPGSGPGAGSDARLGAGHVAAQSDPGTPLLQAWHIWKLTRQGDTERHVLNNCSLAVHAGETVSIHGDAFSGRDQLMAILAGFETPTRGVVLYEDGPLTDPIDGAAAERRRRSIGSLFATGMLLPGLSPRGNVRAVLDGLHLPIRPETEWANEVENALSASGYSGDPDCPVADLERRDRVRVGLATSLVKHPRILLCDAALDGLDRADAQALLATFTDLRNSTAMAIVHATAIPEYAAQAHHRYQLVQGRLELARTPVSDRS